MGCAGAQGGGWTTCWGSLGEQSAELGVLFSALTLATMHGQREKKLPLGAGFGARQGRGAQCVLCQRPLLGQPWLLGSSF